MILGELFGPDLLIVVIVIGVLVFGGSAIPKLARNLGSAKTEFEKGLRSTTSADVASPDVAPMNETDPPK